MSTAVRPLVFICLVVLFVCWFLVVCGGAVASWLVRLTPDRVVQVRALARVIVLYSKARHFTLTVLLFTQVYKRVPANVLGVTPAMD